jgi:hypothetical protein
MDLLTIVSRLQALYESVEHLIMSDERYEFEELIEELEQIIVFKENEDRVSDDEE